MCKMITECLVLQSVGRYNLESMPVYQLLQKKLSYLHPLQTRSYLKSILTPDFLHSERNYISRL